MHPAGDIPIAGDAPDGPPPIPPGVASDYGNETFLIVLVQLLCFIHDKLTLLPVKVLMT